MRFAIYRDAVLVTPNQFEEIVRRLTEPRSPQDGPADLALGGPSTEAIRQVIKEEICRMADATDVPEDLPLFLENDLDQGLGLDSLDTLELAAFIEDRFKVVIPEEVDLRSVSTVNEIVAYVHQLSTAQPGQTSTSSRCSPQRLKGP